VAYVIGTPVAAANPNFGTVFTGSATCTGGRTLVGGGAKIVQSATGNPGLASLQSSYASASGVNGTWSATGINFSSGNGNQEATITAYAICAQ
jgi:hypothetical protein